MAATFRRKIKIVKYLFKMSADSAIGEKMSYTPQHGAGFQRRPDIMKFLGPQGIDLTHFHGDGYAPIQRMPKLSKSW